MQVKNVNQVNFTAGYGSFAKTAAKMPVDELRTLYNKLGQRMDVRFAQQDRISDLAIESARKLSAKGADVTGLILRIQKLQEALAKSREATNELCGKIKTIAGILLEKSESIKKH